MRLSSSASKYSSLRRNFRDSSATRKAKITRHAEIRTVAQGLQKWLDVCENEGRDGRHPVTTGTLEDYKWRRDHILRYDWQKELSELTTPDVIEFRSWLLRNFSRVTAGKLLLSFHSMMLELLTRDILTHDFVRGVSI
jgi:integrase